MMVFDDRWFEPTINLPDWLKDFADKELRKNASKQYLYHYAPKEARDSIEQNGLLTPFSLSKTKYKDEVIEKYEERASDLLGKEKITIKDILAYLEKRRSFMFDGDGGSKCFSVFLEPIPDVKNMNKDLKEYSKHNDLYEIDYNKAVKDGVIEKVAIVEEKRRSERPVELKELMKELLGSKITDEQWKEKGKFYFSGKAHAMIVLKDGILPIKYFKLITPSED